MLGLSRPDSLDAIGLSYNGTLRLSVRLVSLFSYMASLRWTTTT